MTIFSQLINALFLAPFAFVRLRGRALLFLLIYVLCTGALLGLLAALLVTHQEDLRAALLAYLFPASWAPAAEVLIDRFLASQTRAVLANATVSGTLVLVAVLLFPLKEKLSAAFERGAALTDEEPREFPLWFQGLEEVKLVLLYVAVQMAILWIGYHPSPLRKQGATVLSFGFVFVSYAIDFISPTLQRHRLSYSRILKTLLRHPLAALLFGALFSTPAVLSGLYVTRHPALTLQTGVTILFVGNLVSIVWACLGGTWLGAKLLAPARETSRSSWPVRLLAWAILLGALSLGSHIYGSLAIAVHHKSQILKCEYSMVPGTLRLSRPGVMALLRGEVQVGARFDLRINNPTTFDLSLEKNRLEVRHHNLLVATGKLAPMAVPAGEQRTQELNLTTTINSRVVLKGRKLLKDRWTVTLFLEVADGVEFPIYLKHTFAKSMRDHIRGKGWFK